MSDRSRPPRLLLPREHGTYGELLFPLATAFAVSGPSVAGSAIAWAAALGYAAHEGFAVLVGLRGSRAGRELGPSARRTVAVLGGACVIAMVLGVWTGSAATRIGTMLALAFSVVVVILAYAGLERTAAGEVAVAFALPAWGVPVALAGGATWTTSIACAAIWAVVFTASTLGVRTVIARTRRQPIARPVTACVAVSAGAAACLGWLANRGILPGAALWALAPMLAVALLLCLPGITAHQLRRIGWGLVSASAITLAALVVAFR